MVETDLYDTNTRRSFHASSYRFHSFSACPHKSSPDDEGTCNRVKIILRFWNLGRKSKKPTVSPDLVRRVLMLADRRGRDARPIASSGRYRKDLLSRHNQFTGQMRSGSCLCEHSQGYLSFVSMYWPMILCVGHNTWFPACQPCFVQSAAWLSLASNRFRNTNE